MLPPTDRRRFHEVRQRVHLLAGQLHQLLVDDVPIDRGLTAANAVHGLLDDLLEGTLDVASRGGPGILLERASELIRMKRRVFTITERFVADATSGIALAGLARRSRNEIVHARTQLGHARAVREAALAS